MSESTQDTQELEQLVNSVFKSLRLGQNKEYRQFHQLVRKLADKPNNIVGPLVYLLRNVQQIVSDQNAEIESLKDQLARAEIESPTTQSAEPGANPDQLTAQLAEALAEIERLTAKLAEARAEIESPTTQSADNEEIDPPTAQSAKDRAEIERLKRQLAEALAKIERLKTEEIDPPTAQSAKDRVEDPSASASTHTSHLLGVTSCCELPKLGYVPTHEQLCWEFENTPSELIQGVSYTAASSYMVNEPIRKGKVCFNDSLPHLKALLLTLNRKHINPNVEKLGVFFKQHPCNKDDVKSCIVRILRAVQNRAETPLLEH